MKLHGFEAVSQAKIRVGAIKLEEPRLKLINSLKEISRLCRIPYWDSLHMAAKEKEPEQKEAEAPKKSKKKLIIFAAVGLVILIALGVGIPMMMGGKEGEGEGEEVVEEEPVKVLKQAKLDTFIVNLSEQKNFIKLTMLIEYDPEILAKMGGEGHGGGHGGGGEILSGHASGGGANGGEAAADPFALPVELEPKAPMIKDAVIRVLSSKRVEQVLTVEGKEAMKEELIEGINDAIGFEEPPVTNVYFTEFIVQ